MNDAQESVTEWVLQLKQADDDAAQRLWGRYMTQLVELARRKLGPVNKKVADEEDVAIVAFEQFCRHAKQGRFPKLNDRSDLWQILVMLTERRAIDLKRKRPGPSGESSGVPIANVLAREPTPEFATEITERLATLIDALGDEQLQTVVKYKMASFTNEEIAEKLGCSVRTVERKLAMIRKRWQQVSEKKINL